MGRTSGGGGIVQIPVSTFPNQGRILMNPTFLTQSGGFEFLNLMKMAFGGWVDGSGNLLSPANQDANGYPTALPSSGGWNTNIFTPSTTSGAGSNYVVYYNGTGTLSVFGTTFSGGVSGTNRGTLTIAAGPSSFSPISISVLPVTNIAIMLAADESDFLAGKITGSKLRYRINQAKTPVFRNLNWWSGLSSANVTNVAMWSDRKPVGYVSYGFEEYRSSIFAGTTSNSGVAYTAALTGYTLVDKTKVMAFVNAAENNASTIQAGTGTALGVINNGTPGVINWGQAFTFGGNTPVGFNGFSLPAPLNQFTTYYVVGSSISGNTFQISATPGGAAINITGSTITGVTGAQLSTLNVNSTGAVVIRDQFGQVHQPNNLNQLTTGTGVNGLWTFIYNATLNAWQSQNTGITNGVPPEVFLQFCAELGCHPWLVSPPMSCDPMTDWHFQHATYYKNNKPAWMVPRFECINEPWNIFTPAGTSTLWMSLFNWGGYDEVNYVSKIASTIGQDVSAVLGPPSGATYHLIVNMQNGPGPQNDMMNSTTYVNQIAGGQPPTSWNPSGYTKTAAKNYLTHVCSDQYFGPQDYNFMNTNAATASGSVLHFASPVPAWLTNTIGITPGASTASGTVLNFATNTVPQWVTSGLGITDSTSAVIPANTVVTANTASTVTISNAITGAVNSGDTLTFSMGITDSSRAVIPTNTTIVSSTSTTVTISNAVTGGGVLNGDTISFTLSFVRWYRAQWETATGNSSLQQSIVDTSLLDPIGGVPVNLASLSPQYAALGSWAPTFTNSAGKTIGYCGYEGGFASYASGNSAFDAAGKFGTNIQTYYTTNVNNFFSGGGVIPAEFTISGPAPSNDVWSILDDIYVSPDPPQWQVVKFFNH